MAIYRVPLTYLVDIWPAIEADVKRACEYHPFMDSDGILTMLEHELLSLFISTGQGGIVGFGCLEVVQYPRCRVANILAAGGRRGFLQVAVEELLPHMIDYGKSQGCTKIALSGRPGWLRALRRLEGRSERYVTWWADIDEQGRRKLAAPDDHTGTVEAGAAISN